MVEQKNTSTAAGAAPDTKALNPDTTAQSSGEPIDSIAVRAFYSEGMAYIEEGQRYAYTPVEDQPYPYENIHPVDLALDKKYRKEFEDFKKNKRKEIAGRGELKNALRRAAELDD